MGTFSEKIGTFSEKLVLFCQYSVLKMSSKGTFRTFLNHFQPFLLLAVIVVNGCLRIRTNCLLKLIGNATLSMITKLSSHYFGDDQLNQWQESGQVDSTFKYY